MIYCSFREMVAQFSDPPAKQIETLPLGEVEDDQGAKGVIIEGLI
jgi:hypothetical protein